MLSFKKHHIVLWMLLGLFLGCATANLPDYIKSTHPYTRKIAGDEVRITEAVKAVLSSEGWVIASQVNPSVYERRSGGEDQSKDILLITAPKRSFRGLYMASTYLNIFVNVLADGAEVEIRSNRRSDKLASHLLDKIVQELESK